MKESKNGQGVVALDKHKFVGTITFIKKKKEEVKEIKILLGHKNNSKCLDCFVSKIKVLFLDFCLLDFVFRPFCLLEFCFCHNYPRERPLDNWGHFLNQTSR